MKKKKTLFIMLCSMIMSMCFGTNVSAFYWTRYRWSSSSIQYYYDNWIGSKARSALYNGASAWRATNADATINESPSSSRVYCYVLNDPTGDWDGVTECVMDPSTHYFVSQELILNTGFTETWNNDKALQSVVVHEMGHVFGLDENGFSRTIMNEYTWGDYSRYGTYSLTTPQSDDIAGVNSIY